MEEFKIDDLDKEILKALAENCRGSATEIAGNLNVSSGTIHVRLKKLEDINIIKRSTLDINYSMLDHEIVAFIYIKCDFKEITKEAFQKKIQESFLHVTELYAITGTYNFHGKVMTGSLSSLNKIMDEIRLEKGVIELKEEIVLSELFCDNHRIMEIIYPDKSKEKKNSLLREKK